ncbi:MAG: hypothetical protein ACTIC1_10325, partial [Brevibacterium sp.]
VLPGLSVHPPGFAEAVNDLVHGEGWRDEDFGYGRIERLRDFLAGAPVREKPEYRGFGGDIDSERVEPHAPGLADRLWYGGGSLKSAAWAGGAGMNWLMSNITSAEDGIEDFSANQVNQIETFRNAEVGGRGRAGQPGPRHRPHRRCESRAGREVPRLRGGPDASDEVGPRSQYDHRSGPARLDRGDRRLPRVEPGVPGLR